MRCKLLKTAVIFILVISMLSVYAAASEGVAYAHINDDKKIALTFDDGPHPRYTAEILDILEEYGIKATFFVIGENAKRYPELVEREINEGHEIGNHTYSHVKFPQVDRVRAEYEIHETERVVWEISEYRTKIIRPPEGRFTDALTEFASGDGYSVILWSLDTEDWRHRTSDEITRYITDNITSGDIILCHDFIAKDSPTPQALRKFIPVLLENGYKFVTVSELMAS